MQLTGRSGAIVQELYIAVGRDAKRFDTIVKQLEVSGFAARYHLDINSRLRTRSCAHCVALPSLFFASRPGFTP